MIGYSDDARLSDLLAPLRRLDPVMLREQRERRLRRWRPVLVAAVVTAALAGTGVAIAAGLGAFSGISAVEHPQGSADVLSRSVVAQMEEVQPPAGSPAGQLLPESARFARQLPSGERVYAVATTTNELCVLILGQPGSNMKWAIGCGEPLDQSHPTTVESERPNPSVPTLTFGVAVDGVTAVSFIARGQEVTVPVVNNVWAYEGEGVGDSFTVHFADGRTAVVP